MKRFFLGVAVGYVLGTKAGRARYQQIVRCYGKIVDHPAVQEAACAIRKKVTGTLHHHG